MIRSKGVEASAFRHESRRYESLKSAAQPSKLWKKLLHLSSSSAPSVMHGSRESILFIYQYWMRALRNINNREKHKKDQESQHFHSMKRWIWKLGFSSIPSLLFLSHKFLMQTTSICICKCNSELATKLGSCGIRLGDLCDSMQKKIITFCHATGWLEPVGVSLSMLFSSNVK